MIYLLIFLYFHLEFIVDPVSVAAVDGTTVEFTCSAIGTNTITYKVNGTTAALKTGFNQFNVGLRLTTRKLSVIVSSLYNNTEIFCRAEGRLMNTDSEIAILTVQGIHAYN